MSALSQRGPVQAGAALAGLLIYGLGLGWVVGGKKCGVCRSRARYAR